MKIEETLTFRIIKFGLEHDTFTIRKLTEELELTENDAKFIRANLVATNYSATNSNSLFATTNNENETQRLNATYVDGLQCRLLPNALFSYIDHEEIVVARKATEEARVASEKSIKLSQDSIILSAESIELSKKSIKVAWAAIWISVVVGIISVILQAMEVFK